MLLHRGLNFDQIAILKAPRGAAIASHAIRLEECLEVSKLPTPGGSDFLGARSWGMKWGVGTSVPSRGELQFYNNLVCKMAAANTSNIYGVTLSEECGQEHLR